MRHYDKATIAAAFSTVARLVRAGQPVILSKVEGLNPRSCFYFKEAVTHNFNEKDNGFDLQRIFIVDDDNPRCWHRNTSPNKNPGDDTLIDLIIKAMTWLRKTREGRPYKKAEPVETPEERPVYTEDLTDAELEEEIKSLTSALQACRAEYETRQARIAKRAELLKAIREMVESEGESLEDIIGLI